MSSARAIVWLDHQNAWIISLNEAAHAATHLKARRHNTRQHASEVRTEHEFFSAVCEAIGKGGESLLTGSHMALADFKHYVDKHSPVTSKHISGWQPTERLTEGQLVALGREFFEKRDRAAGRLAGAVR